MPTLGGKSFRNRGSSGTPILQHLGSGGGGGELSWAVVNQQIGGTTVVGSSNVDSITDISVGVCDINLSPAFDDANYGVGVVTLVPGDVMLDNITASKLRFRTYTSNGPSDLGFHVVFGK